MPRDFIWIRNYCLGDDLQGIIYEANKGEAVWAPPGEWIHFSALGRPQSSACGTWQSIPARGTSPSPTLLSSNYLSHKLNIHAPCCLYLPIRTPISAFINLNIMYHLAGDSRKFPQYIYFQYHIKNYTIRINDPEQLPTSFLTYRLKVNLLSTL